MNQEDMSKDVLVQNLLDTIGSFERESPYNYTILVDQLKSILFDEVHKSGPVITLGGLWEEAYENLKQKHGERLIAFVGSSDGHHFEAWLRDDQELHVVEGGD